MDQPLRVVVKITARPDAASDMLSILLTLARESRKEPGCIRYEVLRNLEQPHVFVLLEQWASGAQLDVHSKTSHVQEAITKAQPLAAAPFDFGRYAVI